MAEQEKLNDPWLVAVWPGMGQVAVGAGAYLVEKLGARLVHELAARDLFEIRQIEVKEGLARKSRMPRSMFFEWKDPTGRRDLLIFVGEAQPQTGGYALCHRLLDYSVGRGVRRVFTFAAMATQLHPSEDSRVLAVATEQELLGEIDRHGVDILGEGQISGLNGVLLAACAERGLSSACLLAELPFFAVGVPNPRASQAALEVFTELAGIEIDFTALAEQAKRVEKGLLQMLQKMKDAAQSEADEAEESFTVPEFAAGDEAGQEKKPEKPTLDYAARRRIESLFEEASRDRSKAFRLKEELDRLGVFSEYEGRFLDLFKKAE